MNIKIHTNILGRNFSREVIEDKFFLRTLESVYRDVVSYLSGFAPKNSNAHGVPNCFKDTKVYANNVWIGIINRTGEFNPNAKYLTENSKNYFLNISKKEKAMLTPLSALRKMEFDTEKISQVNPTIDPSKINIVDNRTPKQVDRSNEEKIRLANKMISLMSKEQLDSIKEYARYSWESANKTLKNCAEDDPTYEFYKNRAASLQCLVGLLKVYDALRRA